MTTTAELLGKRIRMLRVEQGLSVVQLAGKLDRSTGWFYQLEEGRAGRGGRAGVSVDELVRIATMLGVDMLDLFCDPEDNVRHKHIDDTRAARPEEIEDANGYMKWRIGQREEAEEPRRAAR